MYSKKGRMLCWLLIIILVAGLLPVSATAQVPDVLEGEQLQAVLDEMNSQDEDSTASHPDGTEMLELPPPTLTLRGGQIPKNTALLGSF